MTQQPPDQQPPDQQPTQHAPQQRPSLEKGAPGPAPQQPQPPVPPAPPVAPGPPQPQQQWPVAPPPGPYGSGSGYPPYGSGPGYGPVPGGPVPPSGGGSGKAIALIVGAIVLVVLLFCGGIITAIVVIAKNVEDSIDDWDPERVGGRDNPITVDVGEAFEIDGIEYAEGWQVQQPTTEYDGTTITGLEGTNDRADESSEYASLTFTFVGPDDRELGQVSCTSSGSIFHGNSEELTCFGYDEVPSAFDHIEVSAS